MLYKKIIPRLGMLCLPVLGITSACAQTTTTLTGGDFDKGGVTEYSQYLYIGPGAHITIATGQTWTIASQYVLISPAAVIDGGGQMILDDPADFGDLSESVSWAGQPTTVDGGNSKILAAVINRNPDNIVLGTVTVTTEAATEGIIANTDHTLYIGNSFTWASAHADATAVTGNDVILGNNDFKFATAATEAGYTQNAFAVTNGTGHVVKENYTGSWTFPVGITESNYTPADINNSVANGMHVLVQNYAGSASAEAGSNGIDRTWNIYADNAAGNSIIDLQHNNITNQSNFNIAGQFVTRYSSLNPNTTGDVTSGTAGSWQSNTPAAGSSTGSLTTGSVIGGASERSRAYTDFATTAAGTTAFYSKSSSIVDPLPLKLLQFAGSASQCEVTLTWTTADEQGFDHFDVQYSADGNGYNTIGHVQGKGNAQDSNYSYITEQSTGTGYYRLSMENKDASYILSNTLAIRTQCNNNTGWNVYPNPAQTGSNMHVEINATTDLKNVHITITNIVGQKIMDQPVQALQGKNHYTLPVSDWPKGTYIISLHDEQGLLTNDTQKIILR